MGKKLEPIKPGEILLEEFMRPLEISQNKLARDLDVPIARINDIVHGRRGISADTALRLGKYFKTTPEFWMNLQSRYDIKIVKRDVWPSVEKNIRPIQVPT
jgi:antitoxin HigA-1